MGFDEVEAISIIKQMVSELGIPVYQMIQVGLHPGWQLFGMPRLIDIQRNGVIACVDIRLLFHVSLCLSKNRHHGLNRSLIF